MKLNVYETEHNSFLRENGAECAVLLKKDGHFPLVGEKKIALYGSGVRNTVKGGTGSGEVNSRFFVNVEEGMKNAGFAITSLKWLAAYDSIKCEAKENFIKSIREEAQAANIPAMMLAMGRSTPEPEYEIPIEGEGKNAAYVLARISGEGDDRAMTEGEIRLSSTEIRDIKICNEKYDNFILVINAGGVVDLTPVRDVKNILVLSQLGVETGNILADIILGKQNPSGKLTTTWSAWEDYAEMGEFGEKDETRYQEGIYVGYRYFDSVGKNPLFPFGHGLSYTEFVVKGTGVEEKKGDIIVKASIDNVGRYAGKEVLQLYVSVPSGRLDQPYQKLAAFYKTGMLVPGKKEEAVLRFCMADIASYDEKQEAYIIESGDYILRAGNSSRNTQVVGIISVNETVVTAKAKNVLGKTDFIDFKPQEELPFTYPSDVVKISLDSSELETIVFDYEYHAEIDQTVEQLSDDKLIKLNIGAYRSDSSLASVIGNAGFTVAGAAGQTTFAAVEDGIPSLVMADGPAGLRISREFVRDEEGIAHPLGMPIAESMLEFMGEEEKAMMKQAGYQLKETDTVEYQYATALPIGTAIAQSFNVDFAEQCGDIVGDEMERFGVHLWLAPALNIHRNIRCGRNFEYFSEDPVVSGEFAAAITKGVQKHPGRGTTIKHFAANNQEFNRTQNSSQASERVLREIYLKGFEIAVKKSQPKAVMTSYNLINGLHTAEHRGLIMDILRCEFGYEGIVMTDWTIAEYARKDNCKYPISTAERVAMAGGDLFMPGGAGDYKNILKALKDGIVSKRQLQENASRTARMARQLCKNAIPVTDQKER